MLTQSRCRLSIFLLTLACLPGAAYGQHSMVPLVVGRDQIEDRPDRLRPALRDIGTGSGCRGRADDRSAGRFHVGLRGGRRHSARFAHARHRAPVHTPDRAAGRVAGCRNARGSCPRRQASGTDRARHPDRHDSRPLPMGQRAAELREADPRRRREARMDHLDRERRAGRADGDPCRRSAGLAAGRRVAAP